MREEITAADQQLHRRTQDGGYATAP